MKSGSKNTKIILKYERRNARPSMPNKEWKRKDTVPRSKAWNIRGCTTNLSIGGTVQPYGVPGKGKKNKSHLGLERGCYSSNNLLRENEKQPKGNLGPFHLANMTLNKQSLSIKKKSNQQGEGRSLKTGGRREWSKTSYGRGGTHD